MHEAQAHGEGVTNGTAHPVPQPFFPLHPAVYPPYPQYAHAPPVAYAAPPAVISPPPADANKTPQPVHENSAEGSPNKSKKKQRAPKTSETNGSKSKKAANGANGSNGVEAQDGNTNGYQAGTDQSTYDLPGGSSDLNGTENGHMVSPV